MHIRIANRFRPFSHRPGSACLLPGTRVVVRAYPTRIELEGLKSFDLPHTGPVQNFTLLQDLEKGVVKVFGKAKEGPFAVEIRAYAGKIQVGSAFVEADVQPFVKAKERLSFGCSKQLNWEKTEERLDPTEILPVWYALSQVVPTTAEETMQIDHWREIFAQHFSGIFAPKTEENYLGVATLSQLADPISAGGKALRSLFVETKEGGVRFLPHLPKEFPCGRMTGVRISETLTADFSWTKHFLREVVFHPKKEQTISLSMQKGLSSCRLRRKLRDQGVKYLSEELITISQPVLFDNFCG